MTFDEKIMAAKLDVDGDEITFKDLFAVKTDISISLHEHGARLGYIQLLTADAKAEYEDSKHEAKTMAAEVSEHARIHWDGYGKPTEKALSNAVYLDDNFIKAKEDEFTTMKKYEMLSAIARSLYQHGEMLQALVKNGG